ncbi:hypothetical protein P3T76_001090 [Phytophthora citrophthora]|uniref:Uncharacterized protein n=1 Tax=Phytophthora citrophthora TaxID=4793 RepID=A0AAD9GXX2_9STRA|nr:hypothetical protein P3T76_001090 [Phytophthora citrophthora]
MRRPISPNTSGTTGNAPTGGSKTENASIKKTPPTASAPSCDKPLLNSKGKDKSLPTIQSQPGDDHSGSEEEFDVDT